ncbi:hypothetical protein evm_015533 [Chilo suppressalis]|nr:hypothetical protein evm_015533 [Chilo suppressalis]
MWIRVLLLYKLLSVLTRLVHSHVPMYVSTPSRSVIGWVTKKLLSRAPPCFARQVRLLVPAGSAVVSTDASIRTGPRGGSNLPIPSIGKACALAVGTLIG